MPKILSVDDIENLEYYNRIHYGISDDSLKEFEDLLDEEDDDEDDILIGDNF